MKKIINCFIITMCIFLLPVVVKAENNEIIIDNIELVEKTGNVVEIKEPVIEGLKVYYDIKLKNVNDKIKYKLVIKNNSKKEVELTIKELEKNKYVKYEVEYENNDKIIKTGSTKTMYISMRYAKEVEDSKFKDNQYIENNKMEIEINGNNEENIENPDTGLLKLPVLIFLLLLVLVLIIYFKLGKKSYFNKISIFILLLLMPLITTKALEKITLEINTKITIEKIIKEEEKEEPTQEVKNQILYAFGDRSDSSITTYTDYNELVSAEGHKTFIKTEVDGSNNDVSKSVCLVLNGNLGCFKNNNYDQEKRNLKTFFGVSNCTVYSYEDHGNNIEYTQCRGTVYDICTASSDGYVECEIVNSGKCKVSYGDSVECKVSSGDDVVSQ